MELQWELILFTSFIAWSAGLFGTQALAAFTGAGKKSQMVSWIVAAVLLVVGGIAVFFHLHHWERIFNGFGQMQSGITQELICIVILAIVALVYLVFVRRSEDGASVPKWLAIVALVVSVVLVLVTAHSYMMAARPAWSSLLWMAYMLGNALVLGPATFAVIMAVKGEEDFKLVGTVTLVGAIVALVAAVAYAAYLQMSAGMFADVGYYFDPLHPTNGMADVAAIVAAQMPLLWAGAVAIGGVAPLVGAFVARKQGTAAAWKIWGAVIVVAALVGAICMRMVFYNLGFSIFMYF